MCGICGTAFRPANERALAAAMRALRHRGPDQDGTYIADGIELGHQRLSIIDLSEDGRQPMVNADRSVVVAYNGEIYNFGELRAELMPRFPFRSRTDTEVLVHGYAAWGIDGLLARIRGMFAFAIWDARARTLHLGRDHLGKKPLYYTRH